MKRLHQMLDQIHTMKSVEELGDILRIDSLVVNKIIVNDDFTFIRTTPKYQVAICPKCGRPTNIVHQSNIKLIRDLPCFGNDTFLEIVSRRFRCSDCEGGKYVFTEVLDFIDTHQRQTIRYQKYIARLCRNNTVEFAADFEALSWDAVNRILNMIAAQEIAERTIEPPEYLGVDDIARSKGHIYDTVISDLGRRKVLAVIRGRRLEDIEGYFASMPEEWRNSIKGVSIDMSRTFKAVVLKYLPEAVIVVDRFHISAQLHKRVDEARRHIQNKQRKENKERVFNIRWIILKNIEDLTTEELLLLIDMYARDPSLALCHQFKEEFRLFFKEIKTLEAAAAFIDYWIAQVQEAGIPELIAFGRTLTNWREEILNYWDHSISNGFVEAQNNKIQNIKRRAYGYRNNENYERRILTECG